MDIVSYPGPGEYEALLRRPHKDATDLRATVAAVLEDVRHGGDGAVMQYEERFDHVQLSSIVVSQEEMDRAETLVSDELKAAIRLAHSNISRFHEAQRMAPIRVETAPGVECWQRSVPIERVGLYIPGGTAPLFSTVLMLATPARIAGCREVVLCSPQIGRAHV